MKTLTIITTTYNRAYCIHQVYESLKRQDCDDFCWLVVDDGSKDNTREVIEGFIAEGLIDIEYIYQENKGMTGARNTAYAACRTEINTIIDSDDWLADGAVRKIIDFWRANKRDNIAGIMAHNVNPGGEIIGTKFPSGIKESTVLEIFGKYGVKGDKKLIYRTDIAQKYPYPEILGENFFPPSYKFFQIDLGYKMLLTDDVVCVVDYNDDSMSFDKISQYRRCPNGFAIYYNLCMKIYRKPHDIAKNCLMYIACMRISKKNAIVSNSSRRITTAFLYPWGCILANYLLRTNRKALSVPQKH